MRIRLLNTKITLGFSMVEILVSLVILSIGMVSLAKFQIDMVNTGGLNKARSAALKLAQQKIETLRNNVNFDEFENLTVLATPDYINDPDYTDGKIASTNAIFTRTYMLENGPTANSKVISVNVAWEDTKDGQQNVTLNSIISWDTPRNSARLASADSSGISGPTPAPAPAPAPTPTPSPTPSPTPPPTPSPSPSPTPTPSPPAPSTYSITVSGNISYKSTTPPAAKVWQIKFNSSTHCATASGSGSYSCTVVGVPNGSTPIYTLSFVSLSGGKVCGTDSFNIGFSSSFPSATQDFSHAKIIGDC